MKAIELTKGYVALVDDADYERIAEFKWTALVTGQNIKRVYAYRREDWDNERRVWKRHILMHRFIMDAPQGSDVDHADGNTLNNSRGNLRLCSRSQNLAKHTRVNSNGYRGVAKKDGQFIAQLQRDGKRYVKRGLETAEDAARVYDQMAREHHGEFARLNFPAVLMEK